MRNSQRLGACALCFSLAFSSVVSAGITSKISNLRVRTYTAYIKLEDCHKYAKISLDDEYGKAMYSTALAAAMAGNAVQVGFKDAEDCEVTEPLVDYIDVPFETK